MDVTVPQDHHVLMKENKKVDKHLELAEEARTKHLVKVEIIPIVIEAMGTIPKRLKNFISTLGMLDIIVGAQISVLIGIGRMLRNVLRL